MGVDADGEECFWDLRKKLFPEFGVRLSLTTNQHNLSVPYVFIQYSIVLEMGLELIRNMFFLQELSWE
jgi:hypothetical protein